MHRHLTGKENSHFFGKRQDILDAAKLIDGLNPDDYPVAPEFLSKGQKMPSLGASVDTSIVDAIVNNSYEKRKGRCGT